MDTLLQDLRYSTRTLWRTPVFTVAVVLTLALGIGANTAIFSVVNSVLLRPTPFTGIDRLMMVWETDRNSGTTREPSSVPDYLDFQQRSKRFERLAAFTPVDFNVTRTDADPSRLAALGVSHEFLPMVGIRPIAGRLLSAEDDRPGGTRSALISEELWETQFARSLTAIGGTIRLNDVDWTIVGVLPRTADFGTLQMLGAAAYGRGFAERGGRVRVDIWVGLRASSTASRDNHPILVVGRLAPGASVSGAQQEMTTIARDLERAYPSNVARGVHVEALEDVVFGPVRPALLVLIGAVALVLLVACGNVANLLLVRASNRTREVTVRVALGAGTARLAQQFMVESAVLTVAGAGLGVLFATLGLEAMMSLAPANIPRVDQVGIDGRVLALTLILSVVVAIVFGSLPLWQARSSNLQQSMLAGATRGASAGRAQGRFRSGMVVVELAMAVMLMVGAGLLIKSLWRLQDVNPGFVASGVLKAEFNLPASRYPQDYRKFPNWSAHQRFNHELLTRLSEVPGVQSVAIAAANPMDAGFTSSITVVGREAEAHNWPEPSIRSVSASYFGTMHVTIASGRSFESTDTPESAPVVVINESANQRYFGGKNAIGQRVNLWGSARTVVGIAGNEHFKGLAEASPPAVYLPLEQAPVGNAVLVRTAGDPSALAPMLRRTVHDLDPLLPLFGVESLTDTMRQSVGQRRFTMVALGSFAAVALLLAVIGVHGVLSYSVAQRTREIGIRMALGASANGVQSLIVSEGAGLAAIGLVFGLLGAAGLTRALSTLLYGVGARDPLTFVLVAFVLGAVALVASYLPARRAASVDPMIALRSE